MHETKPNIEHFWTDSLPMAITRTDKDLKIVYMNEESVKVNNPDGSKSLIGSDLMACHNERSREIIRKIIESRVPNIYSITKHGRQKLIYQSAFFDEQGEFAGIAEFSMVLPDPMPHYDRDKKKSDA